MLFNPGIRFGDASNIELLGDTGFLYFRINADRDSRQFRNCPKLICFSNESTKCRLKIYGCLEKIQREISLTLAANTNGKIAVA
jgi:hypothetical protein